MTAHARFHTLLFLPIMHVINLRSCKLSEDDMISTDLSHRSNRILVMTLDNIISLISLYIEAFFG